MGVMTPSTFTTQHRHDTLRPVPSKGTGRKSIRVESELWDEFGAATADMEDGRSGVLRDFMRWFLKKPDATLPTRDSDEDGQP